MECVTAIDNIVAFVQGEVDETLRREVAAHIRNCPTCRREANEVRRTLEVMREAGEDFSPSSRVWVQLMARIKAVRDGLDDGAAGGTTDAVEPYERDEASLPGQMNPGAPISPRRLVAAIAVCVIVVAVAVGAVLIMRQSSRFAILYMGGGEVVSEDGGEPLAVGAKLRVGDTLSIGGKDGSEAQMFYPDGTKLYIQAPAQAKFEAEDVAVLLKGAMRVAVNGGERRFTVRTDYGSVDAVRATFEVWVDEVGRKTRLKVTAGEANFTSAGRTQLVKAGGIYEAQQGKEPQQVEIVVTKRPVDLDYGHKYAVAMAVFDPVNKKFVDEEQTRTLVFQPGEKVRVRFRITNVEDFAILFPRGNGASQGYDVGWIRITDKPDLRLSAQLYFVAGSEVPDPGAGVRVELANNESYEFCCDVPIEKFGLKPNGSIEIYGQYGLSLRLYEHKTNGIKIGLAAAPEAGGEPE